MKEELEKKLFEKYPKIFMDRDKSMQETCMCWGIECPDAWYDMLDRMCRSLQYDTDTNSYPQVIAEQVKEKFGTLRFYYRTEGGEGNLEYKDGYITGTIHTYENMSGDICSDCGINQNISSTKGWIAYICDECKKKREKDL